MSDNNLRLPSPLFCSSRRQLSNRVVSVPFISVNATSSLVMNSIVEESSSDLVSALARDIERLKTKMFVIERSIVDKGTAATSGSDSKVSTIRKTKKPSGGTYKVYERSGTAVKNLRKVSRRRERKFRRTDKTRARDEILERFGDWSTVHGPVVECEAEPLLFWNELSIFREIFRSYFTSSYKKVRFQLEPIGETYEGPHSDGPVEGVNTMDSRLGLDIPDHHRLAALGGSRRKMSTPAAFLATSKPVARRLSNVGITARKFSHGLVFGSGPATSEIVSQGKSLCALYIRSRLKRSGLFTKKCGLQRLRSAVTLPGGYVIRQVLPDLISIGTELERLHPKVYTNVGRQISPLPGGAATSEKALVAGLTSVVKELCRNNVTWPVIVSVYAVAGGLAVDCARVGHPEFMTILVEAMGTALEEDMASWIAENGGWVGLSSYSKPASPEVSLGGVIALLSSLILSAFIVVLCLRWYNATKM